MNKKIRNSQFATSSKKSQNAQHHNFSQKTKPPKNAKTANISQNELCDSALPTHHRHFRDSLPQRNQPDSFQHYFSAFPVRGHVWRRRPRTRHSLPEHLHTKIKQLLITKTKSGFWGVGGFVVFVFVFCDFLRFCLQRIFWPAGDFF